MKNQNTIQQVAKQYNIPAQEVIDFLNDKGISIDFAYQKIEDKHLQQIEKELKNRKKIPLLYVSDEDIKNFKPVTKPIEFWQDANIPNLEKLIYKTLAFDKSKTEKIIGLTPFNWTFAKATYNIQYAKGVKFSLFEDTVCEIVKLREKISLNELCKILGFGSDTEIIIEVLNGLKTDDILQFEPNFEKLSLTTKGLQDIQIKQKSKPAQSTNFELFFDFYNPQNQFAKDVLGSNKASKTQGKEFDFSNFDLIKHLSEEQQPNYQSSKSGFILQEAQPVLGSIEFLELRFIAIVTEELGNEAKNKIWVFNPYKKEISKTLSKTATENQVLYDLITEKLYTEIKEQIIENVEKEEQQVTFEGLLIQSAKEKQIKKSVPIELSHFLSHDSFDSVQFEEEMEKIFEVCKNQLWLVFPFVNGGIFGKRLKNIEKALKNGCSIFVCFTPNENKENFGNKQVVDTQAIQKFEELELQYDNFYFAELTSTFHEKMVFAFFNNVYKSEYSGSFNYLSFYARRGKNNVRRENMKRLLWSEHSEKELSIRRTEFALSFNKRIQTVLNEDKIIGRNFTQLDKQSKKSYYNKQLKKFNRIKLLLNDRENKIANLQKSITDFQNFIKILDS